ncbi:MAG: fibrobacter succinogenes major paralogous domain-containing protein [Bacteroidales bacterium]
MKKLFTFMVAVFLTATLWAQSPEKMSYQAVIRNSSEALVTNTTVGMQISILQGSASGTAVYVETQSPTTNANGLISIKIGDGTVQSGDFTNIGWANGPYFIKTETDPAGGTDYTITGTSQLLSVPYALHAKTAETVTGGITETDPTFTSSQAANINATDITNLSNLSGVNTGDQDLSTLATKTALGDSTAQVRSEIPDVSGFLTSETDPTVPAHVKAITTDNILDWNEAHGWGNHSAEGYATKNMNSEKITNLGNPTNAQDAATKAYVDALLARIEALEESDVLNNGFTDTRDGNHYNAVKIGNQIWMAENLKYLPSVVGPSTGSQSTPYYYVYGYDGTNVTDAKATSNYNTYGVLYNRPAAMAGSASSTANPSGVQGVCPTGWHLPSDAEWTELTDYLGGTSIAGGKLKETGTTHWNSPNTGATNETGFTALPGGYRYVDGSFKFIGGYGFWSSATEQNATYALDRKVVYGDSSVDRGLGTKEVGFSVRCLRD